MKTAEEYWKAFPKHKPAKDADIAEAMREYAKLYASEAIREKEEEIEELEADLKIATSKDPDLLNAEFKLQLAAKDKEIEQLREALENLALAVKHDASDLVVRTRTNTAFEVLAQNAHAEPSGKTEPFTGPVVGIEDGTEFNNGR
jgi:D-mannonate dehydratase